MFKRITKSIHDAWNWKFGGGSTEKATGNVSIETARSIGKSLTPIECHELSIAVHRAVDSIAGNISQAAWRLFTRSGREITGGALHSLIQKPFPRVGRRRLVYQIAAWSCIAGEYAIWYLNNRLYVLNPYKLQIDTPTPGRVKFREDVALWRYTWCDGTQTRIPDNQLIFDPTFNANTQEPVRGLSPLTVGSTQISSSHYATRYNKQFFENSAVPSHMLVLPEGVSRAIREEIERKYRQEFSTWQGNAHKVFIVSGAGDAKFVAMENPMRDAEFLGLQQHADMKVGQLYGVPPIEMQIYDKTRYDSAPMERQTYIESVLKPMMDRIAETFQLQLIDPHFATSGYTTATNQRMSKSLDRQFEKARYEQGDAAIVLLIDADTLPIMAQVKAAQIEQAQKFRDTLHLSPQETIDYFDIDVPFREERDDIWVLNTYSNITHPEKNPAFFMQQAAAAQERTPNVAGGDGAGTNAVKPKPSSGEKRLAQKIMHKLRKLTLEKWDKRDCWTLAEADSIAETTAPTLDCDKGIRRLRRQLREIMETFPEDQVRDELRYALSQFKPLDLLPT